jgi:hypothetical protein
VKVKDHVSGLNHTTGKFDLPIPVFCLLERNIDGRVSSWILTRIPGI